MNAKSLVGSDSNIDFQGQNERLSYSLREQERISIIESDPEDRSDLRIFTISLPDRNHKTFPLNSLLYFLFPNFRKGCILQPKKERASIGERFTKMWKQHKK
jgi:hypothetical protein